MWTLSISHRTRRRIREDTESVYVDRGSGNVKTTDFNVREDFLEKKQKNVIMFILDLIIRQLV